MTLIERICAEQEHPYQGLSIMKIWIDGYQVKDGYSSNSYISIHWESQDDVLSSMRKEYSSIIKTTDCFACERFYVPYPKTGSKAEKLLRFFRLNKINNMKLLTHPVQNLYPLDVNFQMSNEEGQKTVSFDHPITGITHRLHFQNPEIVEMPLEADGNKYCYVSNLMYEIEPDLPWENTLQFNNSISYTEPVNYDFSPTATSSIGIIGRACGPTSIFISSTEEKQNIPLGLHGLMLQSCFSIPNLQKEDVFNFVIEGINIKKYDSKEYNFQYLAEQF